MRLAPCPHFTRPGTSRVLACVAVLVLSVAGCAPKPPASDPDAVADYEQTNDPLEPTNRVFYKINDGLDTVLLRPVAIAYRKAVPELVRDGLHNMLANLNSPVELANDLLEGKPRNAANTTARFLLNSTAGIGGLFDAGTSAGFPDHDADFGLTLALWGVPEGPYLYLPVLGPSDPRDAVGYAADIAMDPFTWMGPQDSTPLNVFKWTRFGLHAVDERERLLGVTESIKKTALDPYATFRSLYRQHRQSQIEALRGQDGPAPSDASPPAPANSK